MDNLISVIVPIYKVEQYLRQCVDSIINQTYKNLEIILVDDGSPDDCPRICDEYSLKDNRIKVIHKENGGLSSARNAGLDIATGDYISFVDSDDYLKETMYDILLYNMDHYNADVSVCSAIDVIEGMESYSNNNKGVYVISSQEEFFMHLLYDVRFEVWNKLFRSSLLSDIRFVVGQVYEDLFFDRCVFSRVNRIAVSSDPCYCYRINRPGSTNSFFNPHRFCAFSELELYFKLFKDKNWVGLTIPYLRLAMNFCINIYCSAERLGAESYYKKELIYKYKHYYSQYNRKTHAKYLLFRMSPRLYNFLSLVLHG